MYFCSNILNTIESIQSFLSPDRNTHAAKKRHAVGFTQSYSELGFQLNGRWHTCSYDWTGQLLPGCTEGFDWPWQLPMSSLVLVLAKCVCIISEVTALPYRTKAFELMFIPLIKLSLGPLRPSLKGKLIKKLHCVFVPGAYFKHYWVWTCVSAPTFPITVPFWFRSSRNNQMCLTFLHLLLYV